MGGEDKVSALVEKNREKLQESRTLKVDKIGKEGGSAEFFVLFTPASSGLQPENVKFVSGDEKFQSYTGLLRKLDYRLSLPDDTPTKILRRGTLVCSPNAKDCMFVMFLTDDVRSVD